MRFPKIQQFVVGLLFPSKIPSIADIQYLNRRGVELPIFLTDKKAKKFMQFEGAKEKVGQQEQQVKSLENRVIEEQNKYLKMETKLAEAERQIGSHTPLESHHEHRASLERQILQYEKQNTVLKNHVKELTNQMQQLQKQLSGRSKTIDMRDIKPVQKSQNELDRIRHQKAKIANMEMEM